jgi:hypothetical protein
MKTLNFENKNDILVKFELSNEEMIKVRGGNNGEPVYLPPTLTVKI